MIKVPKKTTKKAARRPARKALRRKRPRNVTALAPATLEYLESMTAMVKLLRGGWYGARELAEKLDLSHQSPYNRVKKLKSWGFTVDARTDAGLRGPLTRWHISEGGVELLKARL